MKSLLLSYKIQTASGILLVLLLVCVIFEILQPATPSGLPIDRLPKSVPRVSVESKQSLSAENPTTPALQVELSSMPPRVDEPVVVSKMERTLPSVGDPGVSVIESSPKLPASSRRQGVSSKSADGLPPLNSSDLSPADVVEYSLEIQIPKNAPLPAVVAASLDADTVKNGGSNQTTASDRLLDEVLGDYVADAERLVPSGDRQRVARDAAAASNERFRSLYGADAFLKYSVESSKLQLEESH
jgi:hypothetical protein